MTTAMKEETFYLLIAETPGKVWRNSQGKLPVNLNLPSKTQRHCQRVRA